MRCHLCRRRRAVRTCAYCRARLCPRCSCGHALEEEEIAAFRASQVFSLNTTIPLFRGYGRSV